ncbi:MAG: hypothetical protein EBX41_02325 [Chitinophagia bacterium]|nr:hypothetical protein [Chitinophagia bacterium]
MEARCNNSIAIKAPVAIALKQSLAQIQHSVPAFNYRQCGVDPEPVNDNSQAPVNQVVTYKGIVLILLGCLGVLLFVILGGVMLMYKKMKKINKKISRMPSKTEDDKTTAKKNSTAGEGTLPNIKDLMERTFQLLSITTGNSPEEETNYYLHAQKNREILQLLETVYQQWEVYNRPGKTTLNAFLNNLAGYLVNMHNISEQQVAIQIKADESALNVVTVKVVSCMLYFFIRHSFAYTFTTTENCQIDLVIKKHNDYFMLSYKDGADNTAQPPSGAYIKTLQELAKMLQGTFSYQPASKEWTVQFKDI